VTVRTFALFGDSLTAGLGNTGATYAISEGGRGSWAELLRESIANLAGIGPLLTSGVIPVWSFAAPAGPMWSRTGTFTALAGTDAYDKQPDGRGATGSHAADIWTFTKPALYRTPVGFQLYFVDLAGGGDLQYRLDGGTWTNFGQTRLGDNKLMTFRVASGFSSTLDVRHFNGTADVLGCLHGVELVYSTATDGFIVQNNAVNGSALHTQFTSTNGDRLAIIDSVKAGTGSPTLPHPNAGTIVMHINDVARANVTDWAADLASFYARAGPLGPVGFMSPYEAATATYGQAQQTSYRAQTKTSATSLGASGVLDFYDAWSANGWTGNGGADAAGLLQDLTHPSQAGHLDMAPRVYWFVRKIMGVGNVPSAYTARAKQAAVAYGGKGGQGTLLTADTFTRPNSSTAVGATNGAGMLDPRTWTTQQGTCGIGTNAATAINLVTVGTINGAIATIDLGTADADVSLVAASLANATCLVFRFSDTSNYWYYADDGTLAKFRKNVAGTVTPMGSTYSGAAVGDVLRVVCSGSNLDFYRNGVFLERITDAHNQTATKFGFLLTTTPAPVDNWSASLLAPVSAAYAASGLVAVG